jgi:hypothetical protein
MAERVKRRVAAARLAVAFVAAGTIAGAAWAQAGPPAPTAHSSASDIFAKLGDIKGEFVDSANIENGSLLYKDFQKGQIPSFKMFDKLNDSFFKYKKAINEYKPQLEAQIDTIKGELGSYVKLTDADARYVKMGDAVLGDGSVFNATKAIPKGSNGDTLADVPGFVTVEMTDLAMKITNTSGGTLTHASCGPPGAETPGGTLAPGGTLTCKTTEQTQAFQMINGDGKVMTLNFSNIVTPTGSQGMVQILVGL